jgi:NADH-quinone oxidoreductase subunit A
MPELVGYLLLFLTVGVGFIFVHLFAGKFVRPDKPSPEKGAIYECGEPTVGSAWIQFDLRFYVVALLFVIFDVEVAFFFPWAIVFGTAAELARPSISDERRVELTVGPETPTPGVQPLVPPYAETNSERQRFRTQLAPADHELSEAEQAARQTIRDKNAQAAGMLTWFALFDLLVFFGVLLVGFAYLWRRGDLNWVRSYDAPARKTTVESPAKPVAVGR